MPDIGLGEMLVIGIVALIVVGPKDLPVMFHRAGQFVGRMKAMSREFTSAMNDAAKQSGVKDIGAELKGLSNPKQYGLDKISQSLRAEFDDTAITTEAPKPSPASPPKFEAAPAPKKSAPAKDEAAPAKAKAAPAKAKPVAAKAPAKPKAPRGAKS